MQKLSENFKKISLTFKKSLLGWVLGLFIFIPLYPKFPLFNIPGTYVAIRFEDLLIGFIVLWWFIGVLPNLKEIFNQTIVRLILLFWAIGALSLFSGIFLTQTVTPHLGLLHFFRRIEYMILLPVTLTAFTNIGHVRLWLKTMFFVTLAVILYGLGQQFLSFPVVSTTNKEFSKGLVLFLSPEARVNSTFAGHYDLAAYLSLFLAIALVFFAYLTKSIKKVALGAVLILSFILLAFTASRISFIAVLFGIAAGFWLVSQKKLILGIFVLVILAFLISPDLRERTIATIKVNVLGGGGPTYVIPPQRPDAKRGFSIENALPGVATPSGVPVDIAPGEPLDSTEIGVYRSFWIRVNEEWPRALRAFSKNPLLGTGYSSITLATDNDYFRSLGETGLLGTTSIALIFMFITKRMFGFIRGRKKDLGFYLISGKLCALLVLAITATFIDILEASKIAQLLWMSLGVGLAITNMKKEET